MSTDMPVDRLELAGIASSRTTHQRCRTIGTRTV